MRLSRIANALLIVTTSTVLAASPAFGASVSADGTMPGVVVDTGRNKVVPLLSWEAKPLTSQVEGRITAQAAGDFITVYRPVAPCRLVDTRGNGAPITGGPIAANTTRTITTAGNCGIPTSNVKAISASFATFNYTVNNGGYIQLNAPGSPLTGTNDIFNPGAQWSGSTANIPTNTAGSFQAIVAQSTIDLIVDINGYFQDTNTLDSTTQMDINYSGVALGEALGVSIQGGIDATAINASGGTAGTALRIGSGKLAISGASTVNGSNTAFIHQVSAGSISAGCPLRSNISHPMLNGNPNALLFVTPLRNFGDLGGGSDPSSFEAVEYVGAGNTCSANQWRLKFSTNAKAGDQYQILIISP